MNFKYFLFGIWIMFLSFLSITHRDFAMGALVGFGMFLVLISFFEKGDSK